MPETTKSMPDNRKKSASAPKTEKIPTAADIKSYVRKILLASPAFPRLYADVLISEGYNPIQARDLARNAKKIMEANMPVHRNVKACTHIKVTGVRCGSPALRGEQFCYFHQRMLRTVKSPKMRLHHVALLENEAAIQASLMEVVNALIRGTIDLKRGELLLRALNAAVRNSRRARFDIHSDEMVKQLPDCNDEPEPITISAGAQYAEYLRTKFAPVDKPEPIATSVSNQTEGEPLKGTKEAVVPKEQKIERKPPVGVKEVTAPKEQKITAHGARCGTGEN